MISLDYTTINLRWGISGVRFNNLIEYAETLGFLSNISHHIDNEINSIRFNHCIRIYVEDNFRNGAWNSEYRISYYGDEGLLEEYLPALSRASSAGVGAITCRINSNVYINHLISTYEFELSESGYTRLIRPREYNFIIDRLRVELREQLLDCEIPNILAHFDIGWEL